MAPATFSRRWSAAGCRFVEPRTFGMARHRQVEVAVAGGAAIVEAKRRDSVIASQLDEAGLDIGVDTQEPCPLPCRYGQRPGQWLL